MLAGVLVTVGGGMSDAWVYLAHGHVFANAQSGNLVLMAVALSGGRLPAAGEHLISLAAFLAGMLVSLAAGRRLKARGVNSRTVRLAVEIACLVALAFTADRLPDEAVIAAVSGVAGLQITSLSRIGDWSFNTGMTTGNLRSFARAAVDAAAGDRSAAAKAAFTLALSLAFVAGALAGAWLTPRLGGLTLVAVAGLVASAVAVAWGQPDPFPPAVPAPSSGPE